MFTRRLLLFPHLRASVFVSATGNLPSKPNFKIFHFRSPAIIQASSQSDFDPESHISEEAEMSSSCATCPKEFHGGDHKSHFHNVARQPSMTDMKTCTSSQNVHKTVGSSRSRRNKTGKLHMTYAYFRIGLAFLFSPQSLKFPRRQ